ncbi:MAG: hypothetical protein ACP5C4_03480 [Methanomicrobiales archaeon]
MADIGRKTLLAGLFSVLLFGGFLASYQIGESPGFTGLILVGLAGLVISAILFKRAHTPVRPSWIENPFLFSLVTFAVYIFSKYASFFLHEWGHSTAALLTGVTARPPLEIDYGHGWTFAGCHAIPDGVYPHLLATGRDATVAVISMAGPMMNVFLAVLALALCTRKRVRESLFAFFLLFWMALTNVAQAWSYIPLRSVLYQNGDFFEVEQALGISPWAVTAVGTVLIIAGFALVFLSIFPDLLDGLRLRFPALVGLFLLAWYTAFVYYGLTPLAFTLDSVTSPRIWFGVLDVAVGLVLAWRFWRTAGVHADTTA